MSMTR